MFQLRLCRFGGSFFTAMASLTLSGAGSLRLRENIKALTETAEAKQLVARYVSKANDQETRLEQIEKERRAIVEERSRLQAELDLAIRNFVLDRKIK
ncbi:MAG: hypothetical protein ACR2HX_09670 [Pyrinomonadaceae bacterium]